MRILYHEGNEGMECWLGLQDLASTCLNCNGARLKGLKVQNVRGRSLRIRCQPLPAWGAFLGCFFLLGPGGSNRYLKG